MLAAVGGIIDTLPNRVSISGNTSSDGGAGGNWELSAARVNAARGLLQSGGLSSDRIYEVAGKAGSEPLLPENPSGSANRRLSIVLLQEPHRRRRESHYKGGPYKSVLSVKRSPAIIAP